MKKFSLMCPCHFGVESILSSEIKRIGGEDIRVSDGKVEFFGDKKVLFNSNLWLRTAERVFIVLGKFRAYTFDQLFEGVKELGFENFIGIKDVFPVKGWSLNSKLFSVSSCQSIIKKAIVDRLKQYYKVDWFEETGNMYQVQFSIMKDEVCILLDTTGAGLHKRGYRKTSGVAPIKETLAAAIIDISRVNRDSIVYDPFCGSGTIAIEGCMKALNIAPGIGRKFSLEKWNLFDDQDIKMYREEALDMVRREGVGFKAYCYDIDKSSCDLTVENARKAGVIGRMKVGQADIRDFHKLELDNDKKNIVICNPPYGERLLEKEQAEEIYKIIGQQFYHAENNSYYIISSDENFEKIYGKVAVKRRKLYNGMIKCQLYMYFNNPKKERT